MPILSLPFKVCSPRYVAQPLYAELLRVAEAPQAVGNPVVVSLTFASQSSPLSTLAPIGKVVTEEAEVRNQ